MMNFHETRMGHEFFERQLPKLIQSIQALTAALDKPTQAAVLPVDPDPKFLDELYYGNYEPGIFKASPQAGDLAQAIIDARTCLLRSLSREDRERLDLYLDKLEERNADIMRQAFESGYRTAVQMIVAGLSQPEA